VRIWDGLRRSAVEQKIRQWHSQHEKKQKALSLAVSSDQQCSKGEAQDVVQVEMGCGRGLGQPSNFKALRSEHMLAKR
jgi:hypothetical protein